MRYGLVRTISGRGSGPDRFAEALRGIGVDGAGLIYAVGDLEVKVFGAEGALRRRWPTHTPGYCVAVDAEGTVYVGQAGQVEKFDANARKLATWADRTRLGRVTSIGFFHNYVLVADAKDRCIRRYDHRGRWINNIGKDNSTRGFLIPNGVLDFAVDARGVIYASNSAKHRVESYSLEGKLLGHFGRFGTRRPEDFPGCCNPTNLTLSPQGHIVVTEKAGPRMKVYTVAGEMLALVGPEAFDPNCKNMDLACDRQGRIYVADTERLCICVFAPAEAADEGSLEPGHSTAQGATRP